MKPLFPAILSVCALLAALPALWLEGRAVLGAGYSQATRVQAMERGQPRAALSLDSQRRVLLLCRNVISHPDFATATQAQQTAVTAHCTQQVDRAHAGMPSDGYPLTEQANLLRLGGQVEQMLTAVARARALAPNEMWQAELRYRLVQPFEWIMTPAEYEGQNADLRVMVQSRNGMRLLARRYLQDRNFRARITGIVETLSDEDQRRFLYNIRVAAEAEQSP